MKGRSVQKSMKEYVKEVYYGDFPFRVVVYDSGERRSEPLQLNELTGDALFEIEMACKALNELAGGDDNTYIKAFEFDPESAKRIAKAINDYPLSLEGCADILEIMAPLCGYFSMSGAIEILKEFAEKRIKE